MFPVLLPLNRTFGVSKLVGVTFVECSSFGISRMNTKSTFLYKISGG